VGIELILASILLGAGWGLTYALAPIVLTGLVKPDERVRYFAILSVAIMAGFGLSPVLASFMEKAGFSIRDAFYLTAALCALAGMLFIGQSGMVSRYAVEAARQARSKLTLQSSMQILCSRARLPIIMVCIGASIFAGMNNFQTVFADARGLDYAGYFLAYTLTVVFFRAVLARFSGGARPYITIALLQYVMMGSVLLFIFSGSNVPLYLVVAFLFGIGYGVSYPILAAMAAQDAATDLLPQTLLLFALSYFIGIFGFPLIAGWMIVELGSNALLILLAGLAFIEATMAFVRGRQPKDAADAALAS
jgi:MFS family permease